MATSHAKSLLHSGHSIAAASTGGYSLGFWLIAGFAAAGFVVTLITIRPQVPADQALYIGDMVVDIETACAAGVTVWVVPTGSEDRSALETAGPDRILRDLFELMDVFVQKQD